MAETQQRNDSKSNWLVLVSVAKKSAGRAVVRHHSIHRSNHVHIETDQTLSGDADRSCRHAMGSVAHGAGEAALYMKVVLLERNV